MPKVFLIRHGEAAAAWGAHADPALSLTGAAQAKAAAAALSGANLTQVWTSPLRRCRETAAAFCEPAGFTPIVVPEIAEVPTPIDTEDRREWLAAAFPGIAAQQQTLWPDLSAELQSWRAAMIARLLRAEGDTAAFTHFIAINALVSFALDRSETIVFRPAPASITELAVEGGRLHVVALGEPIGDPIVL